MNLFLPAQIKPTLQRFNGIVSWICYELFNTEPEYITPISARSKCNIKVPRGSKAKDVVMQHFLDTKEFDISYTRYGNIQKYCYDIADAVVVAKAGHCIKIENNT